MNNPYKENIYFLIAKSVHSTLDAGTKTRLVLLYRWVEFDKVSQTILIEILEDRFDLFKFYITDITNTLRINNIKPYEYKLKQSILQCSVL